MPIPDAPIAVPPGRTIDLVADRGGAALQVAIGAAILVALAGFGALTVLRHGDPGLAPAHLLVALLWSVPVLLVLELVGQALAMLCCGARPGLDVGILGPLLPYAAVTAAGHRFTRRQYLFVLLAPTVAILLLVAAVVWWTPANPALVFAAGWYLGGCVPEWWLLAAARKHGDGVGVEPLRAGIRLHLPA
jgi:hypothetical protein